MPDVMSGRPAHSPSLDSANPGPADDPGDVAYSGDRAAPAAGGEVLAHPTTIGPAWALAFLAVYPSVVAAMRRSGQVSRRRMIAASVFFLYAVGVGAITVFPIRVREAEWMGAGWRAVIQLMPFVVTPVSFVLNVIMFVPFGVLVPLLWPRADAVGRLAGWAAGTSLGIELTQFVLWVTLGSHRMVDVNDLIANTAGALLGLLLLRTAIPLAKDRAWLAA
jgi:glycopeptide antibiotics resistance protein